jgi:glycosyltransferase involved in cell wall biosynthesis
MELKNFKPTYVWPNTAFPFREYYAENSLRLFIIENIHHNWEWMKIHSPRFQSRDYFIIYSGWYLDDWFLKQDEMVFEALRLDKNKFFILFNSHEEMERYRARGFRGQLINQNCWLDWDGDMNIRSNTTKEYDAVYVARPTPFKRHFLASEVQKLALVTGNLHGGLAQDNMPSSVYRNEEQLSPSGVAEIINMSCCGLILSEIEGACFASSEYLLCGVPVVSTHSKGGRDFWYNNYNSIQVSDNSKEVKEAVDFFVHKPRDPVAIRQQHINLSIEQRNLFIEFLKELFIIHNIEVDPVNFFKETFIHKLRESITPDFYKIWPK